MERIETGDFDFLRIRMEKKFSGADGKADESQDREAVPDMGFSILLPPGFVRAEKEEAAEVYWSQKRPPVIFRTEDERAGITFQLLHEETAGKALLAVRDEIMQIIGQMDKRTVFYDMGERAGVLWFDYKSFAGNEAVYNLVFLFQTGKRIILGTFYCIFEIYDIWRSEILEMTGTIKRKENEE